MQIGLVFKKKNLNLSWEEFYELNRKFHYFNRQGDGYLCYRKPIEALSKISPTESKSTYFKIS